MITELDLAVLERRQLTKYGSEDDDEGTLFNDKGTLSPHPSDLSSYSQPNWHNSISWHGLWRSSERTIRAWEAQFDFANGDAEKINWENNVSWRVHSYCKNAFKKQM